METFGSQRLAQATPFSATSPTGLKPKRRVRRMGLIWLSILAPLAVLMLSGPAIAQLLQPGDNNSDVRSLQADLNRLGYTLTIDGVYGENTTEMVKRFQQQRSLRMDGIVGLQTRQALDQAVGRTRSGPPNVVSNWNRTTLKRGDRSDSVRYLQGKLCRSPYACAVNGQFDADTETAVRQFQRDKGLVVDGIVGPVTWAAVEKENQRDSPIISYTVLIPMDSKPNLGKVRQFVPNASVVSTSRLGPYIQAGTYRDRGEADKQAGMLRVNGFDAQVRRL